MAHNGLQKLSNIYINLLKPKNIAAAANAANVAKKGGIIGKSFKFLGKNYLKYMLPTQLIHKSLTNTATTMEQDFGRIMKEMPAALQPVRSWAESVPKLASDISTGGSI